MKDFIFDILINIGYNHNNSAPDKLFKYLSNNDVDNMKDDFLWLEDIKFGEIRYMLLEIYSDYYNITLLEENDLIDESYSISEMYDWLNKYYTSDVRKIKIKNILK
jgi:hypothetical protein